MIIRPNQPGQPAGKSNFSSGGGKNIPDFNHAKSLINELSGTLVARIEVSFPGDTSTIPKLSEQDYAVLSPLPSPDLVEIFKDAIPCDEFRSKPQSEFIDHIKEFLKKEERYSSYEEHFNEIKSKILILRGEEFKNTSAFLLKNAPPKQSELFHFEIFKMAQEEKKSSSVKRYSKIAASKEFADFCNILRTEHGISPYDDLIKTLNHYIDPAERQYLKSSQSKELVKILKKYFPKLNFEDLHWTYALNNILNILGKENLENAVKEKMKFYPIIKSYSGEISNIYDLASFLTAPAEVFALLNTPLAKETWDCLKNSYKDKISSSPPYVLKDFVNFLKEFDKLEIKIKELDEFLMIFSISLQDINVIHDLKFKKITSNEIKTALYEADFKNYINEFFAKHPVIKENMLKKETAGQLEDIEFLMLQYKNKEGFNKKISEYLKTRKRGFDDFSVLEDTEFISLILNKFEKIYNNCSEKIDPEVMRAAVKKIDGGRAEEFYNALTNKWGLTDIGLGEFILYLAENEEEFYINAGNIKKFETLKEKYIILYDNHTGISSLKHLPRDLFKLLLEDQEFLCDDTAINNLCRYFPDRIKIENNKKQVKMSDLVYFTKFKVLKYGEFSETFEKEYGFSAEDFSFLNFSMPYMNEGFLAELKDPNTLNNFKNLQQFYRAKNKDIYPPILFLRVLRLKESPLYMKALAVLDKYGVKADNTFILYYLSEKDVVNNINNPDFFVFYEKVTAHFDESKMDPDNIYHISKLYDAVNKDPRLDSLLFSDRYKKIIEHIQIKFVIPKLDISSMLPVLMAAEHFDEKKLEIIIEYLEENGEKVKISDLAMILEAIKNKNLEHLLRDKTAIMAEVEEILNIPPAGRKNLDELIMIEEEKNYHNKSEIDEKIKNVKEAANERPSKEDLKKWPAKELLRVVMLKRALQNPEFLRQIALMLIKDADDLTAEAGGEIDISGNGGLALRQIPSDMQDDGSYSRPPTDNMSFAYFHCHSLGDFKNPEYSGPSSGDKKYAERSRLTSVLFTNLGHPKDASGKEDKNKLLINVDLYFVIDGKTYILDMGVRSANL